MTGNKKHAFSVPYFKKISILFIYRVAFVFFLANTLGNCAFSSKANIRRVRVDRVDTLKARKPKYIIIGTTSHSYLGSQGVRVMMPPPPASGSHCSNIRTLCSSPPPSPQNSRGPCPAMLSLILHGR